MSSRDTRGDHSTPAGTGRLATTGTALAAALLTLAACDGGSGGGTSSGGGVSGGGDLVVSDGGGDASTPVTKALAPGPNGSYLFVSAPDFYFGTRDVGTSATQQIELANRGGDIYPINSVIVTGEHAEEFVVDLRDPVTLNPAEKISLGVTFAPIDQGRKFAELDIDFDTIVQVDAATNANEQNYYRARDLEDQGDYRASFEAYDEYVDNRPVTVNKRRAAIKLPVIREASVYGSDADFELYLDAMNAREAGELERATAALDTLLLLYGDSYLADDALYLKGYIDLMDRADHASSLQSFQALRSRYPDTTYYDTALYGEALAQQGLGNHVLARSIYLDLRLRHTGVDTLGITLPKDDLLSRLWFERASDGLASLDAA